ncbi:MAG: ABC-ATPase domain-containing protein, partial [Methanobacterium sp.]|nr:ABC-ATPase domain-containing protein [Methanobacterium sp.]
LDGRGYKNYNEIRGIYKFDFFTLEIIHVQRDPFASPSLIRILMDDVTFPRELLSNTDRRIAVSDYIGRVFNSSIKNHVQGRTGSGKSGVISIDSSGPEILERTSVFIDDTTLEIRLSVGLPARGRKILGKEAKKLFLEVLPKIIMESCIYHNVDGDDLRKHVFINEDSNFIRTELKKRGVVAFILDGSLLPRRSGISEEPFDGAVKFKTPESLLLSIETPNHGTLTGMGIPEGVTLVVGGGYHGKSTLLHAIELGIYNHRYRDGREMVVTDPSAVKIRAEDGRKIENVDISSFIHNPPMEKNTRNFSSENASGSTSQAANIVEAIEAGSKLLLFDEDTSATNFMIRDERMQKLVATEKEPITPFIDRVKELYTDHGVSTILVMGGSGDYFEAADTVIMMDNYVPYDVTERAMQIKEEIPINRKTEVKTKFSYEKRYPISGSVKAMKGRKLKLDSRGKTQVLVGKDVIDISQVEQLVDSSQTRTISYALHYAAQNIMDGKVSMEEVLKKLEATMDTYRLDVLAPSGRKYPNNLARPRSFEIAAALNRLRTLKTTKST